MICPKCGAQIEGTFCNYCGTDLKTFGSLQNNNTVYVDSDKVLLKNRIGLMKTLPMGHCWTGFFFPIFVPLFRQDWISSLVILGLYFAIYVFNAILGGVVGFVMGYNGCSMEEITSLCSIIGGIAGFCLGIALCVGMLLKYNEICIKHYIKKGYTPINELEAQKLAMKGIFCRM